MSGRVVLVCGGRAFAAFGLVIDTLDGLGPISKIIQGGAAGADFLGRCYAAMRGIPLETYRADWQIYKRAAGPIRNQRMIDEGRPDLVVAFPGGRGTRDMIARARAAKVPTMVLYGPRTAAEASP